ncbi:hypothetical protein RI129_006597 [Pyrocoelia pectoralis]|uniref:IkappaB kinase n=1 Tax=Pyrocoelia pectoralis TaxID=417401 RepID=A0AAN7VCQ9_9COLE
MFKHKKSSTVVDITGEPTNAGEWRRDKELGSGGFGVVHLWVNKTTGDSLAIKKCRWNLESHLTEKQRERWTVEVEIMKGIRNENIVAYRKMPEDLNKVLTNYNCELPILSMEYCRFGNLRSVLARPENCCGLQELDILCIINDVANALQYLHKLSVIHRDIKPENIVLQLCDNRPRRIIYKLIDLGYAKEIDSETASFVGTLQYLAPEIFIKQKCTKTVDYWSFGIVTFEIICGMRPFLHTFTPWQSIAYLEKKQSEVISMQLTYNGEIKLFTQLCKENHINVCLTHLIEKWLQIVLEFSPDQRGCFKNGDSVFTYLQEIVLKKIITIYSVYTCEFLSYEINDSTLLSTVQGWIGRDTKIPVTDQYIVSSRYSDSIYATDYYDKQNPVMLFVFNKSNPFATITTNLPPLIKILFENFKTEFKFGTIKQLHAQTMFLVLREIKYVSALNSAIISQYNNLQTIFDKFNLQYTELKDCLMKFLNEVEVYNYQDASLLKVYENANYNHVLEKFKGYMLQLAEVIDIFNRISLRCVPLCRKLKQIESGHRAVFSVFEKCKFEPLIQEACGNVMEVSVDNPIDLTGGPKVFKLVSSALKIKDTVLSDNFLISYVRCVSYCWKEIEKLNLSLAGLSNTYPQVTTNIRQLHMEKIKLICDMHKMKVNHMQVVFNEIDVLEENISLRYKFQELMDIKFRQMPNENVIYAVPVKKIQD